MLLLLGGLVLSNLYRDKVQSSFEKSLELYLENLIAKVNWQDDGTILGVGAITDPRFDTILSGWYWQIRQLGADEDVIFASRSLSMDTLVNPVQKNDPNVSGTVVHFGPRGENLRSVWQLAGLADSPNRYLFMVAGNLEDIDLETRDFRRSVISALAILGFALMITAYFQIRYGLKPLRSIGDRISAIRAGRATKLEGDFPTEIQPLAMELNELVTSNTAIIERARTHVGNLAHSLKTPLSVISNEARQLDSPVGKKILKQSEMMLIQITHHLDRARVAGQANVIGAITEVSSVAQAIKRTMERLNTGREIAITMSCPEDAQFAGERQDLEEILGNLFENACKWGETRVEVTIEKITMQDVNSPGYLQIVVDDDGPGVSPGERERMMRRGARSDETKPGSGLGLSIVAELVDLYQGKLVLANAPMGGLRVELKLPAV